MPKHNGVLALKYLEEFQCVISIGTEGEIILYGFTKPTELNLFPVKKVYRLIWNQVSAVAFLTDKEIIAGIKSSYLVS